MHKGLVAVVLSLSALACHKPSVVPTQMQPSSQKQTKQQELEAWAAREVTNYRDLPQGYTMKGWTVYEGSGKAVGTIDYQDAERRAVSRSGNPLHYEAYLQNHQGNDNTQLEYFPYPTRSDSK